MVITAGDLTKSTTADTKTKQVSKRPKKEKVSPTEESKAVSIKPKKTARNRKNTA